MLHGRLELPPLAAELGEQAADLGLGGASVGLRGGQGRPLDVDLDLVGFRVEFDEQVSGFDPGVVVHQHPPDLARHPRGATKVTCPLT
ncbi:MAG TPA: hypothetical protein VKE74_01510 [Gemmataceae bacterium]|nr:hypothetical protein [Gemmataceae bacterium]